MTTLIVVVVLIAVAYAISVWLRGVDMPIGKVLENDLEKSGIKTKTQPPHGDMDQLFQMHGRKRDQATAGRRARSAAAGEPTAPGGQAGKGQRTTSVAPCWICGKPNMPGHTHR
jgi:hypothetical protein